MVLESTDITLAIIFVIDVRFTAKVRYFPEAYILYARIYTMCKILETLYPGRPGYN